MTDTKKRKGWDQRITIKKRLLSCFDWMQIISTSLSCSTQFGWTLCCCFLPYSVTKSQAQVPGWESFQNLSSGDRNASRQALEIWRAKRRVEMFDFVTMIWSTMTKSEGEEGEREKLRKTKNFRKKEKGMIYKAFVNLSTLLKLLVAT